MLALERVEVPELRDVRGHGDDHVARGRMHTQAHNGSLVALHPSDQIARLRVEALDGAIDGRHQVLGLALQVERQDRASGADTVQAHEAVVAQVEHVDVAMQIASDEAVACPVEAQVGEADLLGRDRQFVAQRVLDVEKEAERDRKTFHKTQTPTGQQTRAGSPVGQRELLGVKLAFLVVADVQNEHLWSVNFKFFHILYFIILNYTTIIFYILKYYYNPI